VFESSKSVFPSVLQTILMPVENDSCSIQFNSIQFILYSPSSQITNFPQRALQSVPIRHPCPKTSHRIRKNSQEIEKKLLWEKKGINLQESNRGGSLSPDGQVQ